MSALLASVRVRVQGGAGAARLSGMHRERSVVRLTREPKCTEVPSSSCRAAAAAAAAAGRSVVDMPTAMRCTCHHDRRKPHSLHC
jgi:hypothetical protein